MHWARYVYRVEEYNKKAFQYLTTFFTSTIVEGIAIICKKLNSHSGFLSADQDRAKKYWQMGWIGCPILLVAQNTIMIFKFLLYFCKPRIKWIWKTLLDRLVVVFQTLYKHTLWGSRMHFFKYFFENSRRVVLPSSSYPSENLPMHREEAVSFRDLYA